MNVIPEPLNTEQVVVSKLRHDLMQKSEARLFDPKLDNYFTLKLVRSADPYIILSFFTQS